MDGAIICGGEKFVIPGVEVHTWHDDVMRGLHFTTENSAVARRLPPKWLVYHWTASERTGPRGAKKVYDSLSARKLSVEFFIDNLGVIYQYCDPNDVRCRHASRVNEISIGVEVSCVGWNKPGRRASVTTESRPQYKSPPLHGGWRPNLYDYFPVQTVAACGLADAVTLATGIPRTVLGSPWERRARGFFERSAGGVCGHLHCAWLGQKHPKCDPGPAPLIAIAEHFASA